MAGKFTNTSYSDKLNNITDNFKKILNNPYYLWINQKGTTCTYYQINKQLSTLDEAAKIQYATIGKDSPIWYNKIIDFILYGMDRIQLNIDMTDFGPDSEDITGEAVVLPNTIEPCPGDLFTINHVKGTILFKIIDVQPDTLENGNNLYAVTYKLSYNENDDLEKWNIAKTYRFLVQNVGKPLACVISDENFNSVKELEDIASKVREFYKAIFANNRVQSLTFGYGGNYFYDPYMVEFVKSTNVLSGSDRDVYYLQHLIDPGSRFAIIYNRTLFVGLIEKNKDKILKAITSTWALAIDSKISIFASRFEDYFQMTYEPSPFSAASPNIDRNIPMFDADLPTHIYNNKLYPDDVLYNIIIKYMNDVELTKEDFKNLEWIDYVDDSKLFYAIPCVLYCIERTIEKLMS